MGDALDEALDAPGVVVPPELFAEGVDFAPLRDGAGSPPSSVRLLRMSRFVPSFMFWRTRATVLISPWESFFMDSFPVSR